MALGKYSSASSDYEYVKKVCPNDKDATMKYEECKKIVTRIRFEKAIAVDESAKSVVNQIDLNSMSMFIIENRNKYFACFFLALEADYDGPHLEGDSRVTKEFMLALLPYLENQKKLHKRYAYQVWKYIRLSKDKNFI
jgi:serine/threonine-protein phosphatase 5